MPSNLIFHSLLPVVAHLMTKALPALFQGADKTVKGPDGLTAFEATDNQAIKALLQ